MSPSGAPQPDAVVHARRRPETTALHQVVRDNLLTLYAAIEQGFASALPAFVRDERSAVKAGTKAAIKAAIEKLVELAAGPFPPTPTDSVILSPQFTF